MSKAVEQWFRLTKHLYFRNPEEHYYVNGLPTSNAVINVNLLTKVNVYCMTANIWKQ